MTQILLQLGLGGQGTSSLLAALTQLDIRSVHIFLPEGLPATIQAGTELFVAPRTPWGPLTPDHLQELERRHPGFRAILLTRDPEKWLENRIRFSQTTRLFSTRFHLPLAPEQMLELRQEREVLVRESIPADRVLNWPLCEQDSDENWQTLCRFLDLPVPDLAFPSRPSPSPGRLRYRDPTAPGLSPFTD